MVTISPIVDRGDTGPDCQYEPVPSPGRIQLARKSAPTRASRYFRDRWVTVLHREQKRTILTEFESKQLLTGYGIPTVRTLLAIDEDRAAASAGEIGYPVVLKLHSTTITHKTDVGGVRLN